MNNISNAIEKSDNYFENEFKKFSIYFNSEQEKNWFLKNNNNLLREIFELKMQLKMISPDTKFHI